MSLFQPATRNEWIVWWRGEITAYRFDLSYVRITPDRREALRAAIVRAQGEIAALEDGTSQWLNGRAFGTPARRIEQ